MPLHTTIILHVTPTISTISCHTNVSPRLNTQTLGPCPDRLNPTVSLPNDENQIVIVSDGKPVQIPDKIEMETVTLLRNVRKFCSKEQILQK